MGVIQKNYYYPSVEEIHIGYIGIVNHSRGYNDEFVPLDIKLKEPEGAYLNDIIDIVHEMDDGCIEVKVPLLTKEDILSLGWVHMKGFFYEWPIKETLYCDEISSRTLDWRLNWASVDRSLKIEFYERNHFEWYPAFEGPCPTINDLKYLMRLLKIEKPD